METFLAVVLSILLVDVLGFVAWAISGQTPADAFFIGAVTSSIVK